jgi:hypothetical protein
MGNLELQLRSDVRKNPNFMFVDMFAQDYELPIFSREQFVGRFSSLAGAVPASEKGVDFNCVFDQASADLISTGNHAMIVIGKQCYSFNRIIYYDEEHILRPLKFHSALEVSDIFGDPNKKDPRIDMSSLFGANQLLRGVDGAANVSLISFDEREYLMTETHTLSAAKMLPLFGLFEDVDLKMKSFYDKYEEITFELPVEITIGDKKYYTIVDHLGKKSKDLSSLGTFDYISCVRDI